MESIGGPLILLRRECSCPSALENSSNIPPLDANRGSTAKSIWWASCSHSSLWSMIQIHSLDIWPLKVVLIQEHLPIRHSSLLPGQRRPLRNRHLPPTRILDTHQPARLKGKRLANVSDFKKGFTHQSDTSAAASPPSVSSPRRPNLLHAHPPPSQSHFSAPPYALSSAPFPT